jgi:hypothetical protein
VAQEAYIVNALVFEAFCRKDAMDFDAVCAKAAASAKAASDLQSKAIAEDTLTDQIVAQLKRIAPKSSSAASVDWPVADTSVSGATSSSAAGAAPAASASPQPEAPDEDAWGKPSEAEAPHVDMWWSEGKRAASSSASSAAGAAPAASGSHEPEAPEKDAWWEAAAPDEYTPWSDGERDWYTSGNEKHLSSEGSRQHVRLREGHPGGARTGTRGGSKREWHAARHLAMKRGANMQKWYLENPK